MTEKQSSDFGPEFRIQSWTGPGKPGNSITEEAATGGSAHIEIENLWSAEKRNLWDSEYRNGIIELRDNSIQQAAKFVVEDSPAKAIVTAKIALSIPLKTIADQLIYMPNNLRAELNETIGQSHEKLAKLDEINEWANAVNFFSNDNLLAAGMGSIELGNAYRSHSMTQESVNAYKDACAMFKKRFIDLGDQTDHPRHEAEVYELKANLSSALGAIIGIYAVKGTVIGRDKEIIKSTVYELDDIDTFAFKFHDLEAPTEAVKQGYKLLAKSSIINPLEMIFYLNESARLKAKQKAKKIIAENRHAGFIGIPTQRRLNRKNRPPINKQKLA